MPNYGTVRKLCKLRNKEALFPETFVAEIGGTGKLVRYIEDCLSRDGECRGVDCKYSSGKKDPLI